jgi:hypothetical protein
MVTLNHRAPACPYSDDVNEHGAGGRPLITRICASRVGPDVADLRKRKLLGGSVVCRES